MLKYINNKILYFTPQINFLLLTNIFMHKQKVYLYKILSLYKKVRNLLPE